MYSLFEIVASSADPVYDLTTLEAVKLELDISGTGEDAAIEAAITRLSRAAADYTGRHFALLDIIEQFVVTPARGYGYRCGTPYRLYGGYQYQPLVLRHTPIVSMDTVTIDGSVTTAYEYDAARGLLYFTNGSATWSDRVVVTYTGGYDLPDDAPGGLASEIIEAIRQERAFSTRDPTVREVAHGDTRVGYYSGQLTGSYGLPSSLISVLDQYRRPVLA